MLRVEDVYIREGIRERLFGKEIEDQVLQMKEEGEEGVEDTERRILLLIQNKRREESIRENTKERNHHLHLIQMKGREEERTEGVGESIKARNHHLRLIQMKRRERERTENAREGIKARNHHLRLIQMKRRERKRERTEYVGEGINHLLTHDKTEDGIDIEEINIKVPEDAGLIIRRMLRTITKNVIIAQNVDVSVILMSKTQETGSST